MSYGLTNEETRPVGNLAVCDNQSRFDSHDLQPGDTVELAEPRNLIAAQCGTAPEVLSRTFRRFEEDGVLSAAPRHVTVHQPDRLRELAEHIE